MSWADRNQQWLAAAIARLRARMEACARDDGSAFDALDDRVDISGAGDFTPALVRCANAFALSPFERELLLLLAGIEVDRGLRSAVRAVNGGSVQVTFSFALAALTQPHWDALSPDAPLRHWRLIYPESGASLTQAALRIDERILHFLIGVDATDARIAAIAHRLPASSARAGFADDALIEHVTASLVDRQGRNRVVMLHNDPLDSSVLRDFARAVAQRLSTSLLWIQAHDLPGDASELHETGVRVDREVALTGAVPVLLVEPGDTESTPAAFASGLRSALLWLGATSGRVAVLPQQRRVLRIEIPPAQATVPSGLINSSNGTAAALARACAQFRLDHAALEQIVEQLDGVEPEQRTSAIWAAARESARGGLDALAQRIVTNAGFDDLVLPPAQLASLRDIARHLRHRDRVYREWGFGEKHTRGQGLTALFAGESGTGKTLAAEAIANEVKLDLYRVDLATVVSKYIGETEKNLKRVFDAAEASGAVLLFDEADALFGKRSEVKDSHDRYANIEVAYLLQRVEAYRGLAILTTNMKTALDRAFLRRIRFVIHFPFPDAGAREQIWRRQFPARAPLGDVDFRSLASMNLSGGHINSIAISAAFSAADRAESIGQRALIEAARAEFAKLERTFVAPQVTQ